MSVVKFHTYSANEIALLVRRRVGETKLGEEVKIGTTDAPYTLIGIPESVGVRANQGVGGTETLWPTFLSAFLNIQSTPNFKGDEISVLGYFEVPPTATVADIDEAVASIIAETVQRGSFPLVVGGGHNNAFPLLKGTSLAKSKPMNAINLDAHADFRPDLERHSGNPFSQAMQQRFLNHYAVIGLHENYNSANMMATMQANPQVYFSFIEDIFLRETTTLEQECREAIQFTQHAPTGIELDVDCIENVLASAATPVGFTPREARKYAYLMAQHPMAAYLHVAEGASQLANGQSNPYVGKLVAYLVSDFVKSRNSFLAAQVLSS